MLPALDAFEKAGIAAPVAVALAGFAWHMNSSPFMFRQEYSARLGLLPQQRRLYAYEDTVTIPHADTSRIFSSLHNIATIATTRAAAT
jgi:hypothetical protein